MIVNSENYLSFQHLAWQPSFNCIMTNAKECKECYVNKSPAAHYTGELVSDIVDLIYKSKKAGCEQFTISLDTLKEPPTQLIEVLKFIWDLYSNADDCGCENITRKYDKETGDPLPELCITIHNYKTLKDWAMWLFPKDRKKFLNPLTMLSISTFPSWEFAQDLLNVMCKHTKTILNYNKLCIGSPVNEEFKAGIRNSDHTYLVMEKPALGQKININSINKIAEYGALIKNTSSKSFDYDTCYADAVKHLKTNGKIKCGAGITKAHIWPNGSVSGCPYDSFQIANGAILPDQDNSYRFDTWHELKRIRSSAATHPMNYCKIPEALQALKDMKKNKLDKQDIKQ